jgi:hypothetical protein
MLLETCLIFERYRSIEIGSKVCTGKTNQQKKNFSLFNLYSISPLDKEYKKTISIFYA